MQRRKYSIEIVKLLNIRYIAC